ncbi:short-chain dehydrogenase [Apiospora rasikravindrae]|uniref:Short-chain dehydrogenase n=1 Tax=Apiospora rasikravindrae TaxID=990691 RepID=A0ABR1SKV7_9PEZI
MPFKRTFHNVDPSATDYTAKAGVFDTCSTLVAPTQPTYYQSYWFMYFLHGTNGHDYFVVGHVVAHTLTAPPKPVFRVCLLDIDEGYWFGETFPALDSVFALDAIHCKAGDRFEVRSTRPGDHASPILCKSTVEGAQFELVASPRGPTLYAGGQGTFFWGTDWTYQMSFPEMWVTGTFKYKGEVIEVVPEKSMAWLDRQYGMGVGKAGWDLYMLILENGMKASIWRSQACGSGSKKQYVATVVYPDSHHEIYPVDNHIELSQPFVSEETGYLYHAHQVLTIAGLDARIELQQPWPVGEMAIKGHHDPVTTLFEGYVNVKGRIRGEEVKGWGVSERRVTEL